MTHQPLVQGPGGITVTIVTPCYNGARFLRATIESVLAQTRPALEMIVIDDGSTDDSAAIAESFGPPVRVIRQANQGESVARNRGIADARGSHLLFLDADDLLAPAALEHLAAALEGRPGAVALMGCARFAESPDTYISVTPPVASSFYPLIIGTNFGPPHCWMAPTDVVRRAGGFCDTLQWSEDWDILWRIGIHASALVPVDYVGALYRQHPQSQYATTSKANRARGYTILAARMADEFLKRAELFEVYGPDLFWGVWTALKNARANGVPWGELQYLRDSLVRVSRRLGEVSTHQRTPRLATFIRLVGVAPAIRLQGLWASSGA